MNAMLSSSIFSIVLLWLGGHASINLQLIRDDMTMLTIMIAATSAVTTIFQCVTRSTL